MESLHINLLHMTFILDEHLYVFFLYSFIHHFIDNVQILKSRLHKSRRQNLDNPVTPQPRLTVLKLGIKTLDFIVFIFLRFVGI